MFTKHLPPFLLLSLLSTAVSTAIANESSSEEETESWAIEKITVTAQKRIQTTQDLGLAVTAISGDSLRDQGIAKAEDLSRVIPNVDTLNVSGGGVPIVIVRGVGLQNFRVNDSPATAFYVDDVYQTSVVSADFTMFDLERVELLKGPQGGLYGRNTIAGAIQVISAKPNVDEGVDGYMRAVYGEYNRTDLEGAVSIPLSDKAAMRVAGRWEQSDDTEYQSVTGDFSAGEVDRWAGRTIFHIKPNDDINLMFKVHGGEDKSDLPLLQPVAVWADIGTHPAFPNVAMGALLNSHCASLLAGEGSGSDCVNISGVSNGDYGLTGRDEGRHESAANELGFLDNQWSGVSLNADIMLNDYILTSISAYDTVDYRRFSDLDGLSVENSHVDYNTQLDAWSQEFRLSFTGSDTYNWILGVNYAEDELSEDTVLMGKDGVLAVAFGGASSVIQVYEQSTKAFSVYGHGEWRFSEKLNLVSEIRYTKAEKTFSGFEDLGFTGDISIPYFTVDDSVNFSDTSGKVALEWANTTDFLTYLSISKGFKTGGFFGGFVTDEAQYAPYDAETILAYETGFKSDWVDGNLRVNGSMFFYDRSDVQQTATEVGDTTSISRMTNVGDVDVKGAELDIIAQPIMGLSLQLGLGYTDSEVVDSELISSSIPGLAPSSIEGTNTPNYSKYSAFFLSNYERSLTDMLYGRVQFEYSYRSERDLNLVTSSVEEALFTEPGFGLANFRVGLGAEDGSWETLFFVENIADTTYRTLLRGDGLKGMHTLYGKGRTWGLSFTYNWD